MATKKSKADEPVEHVPGQMPLWGDPGKEVPQGVIEDADRRAYLDAVGRALRDGEHRR